MDLMTSHRIGILKSKFTIKKKVERGQLYIKLSRNMLVVTLPGVHRSRHQQLSRYILVIISEVEDDAAPVGDDTAPVGDDAAPIGDNTAPYHM